MLDQILKIPTRKLNNKPSSIVISQFFDTGFIPNGTMNEELSVIFLLLVFTFGLHGTFDCPNTQNANKCADWLTLFTLVDL